MEEQDSILGIPKNRIEKEGIIQFYDNKKKRWISRVFFLCGSALYYHKKGDDKIEGPVLIKDAVISISNDHPNPKKKKKPHLKSPLHKKTIPLQLFSFQLKTMNQGTPG